MQLFIILSYFITKEGEGSMSILLKRILHLSSENVSCCSDTAVVSPAGWTLCYKGKETLPLYHSVIWPGETTACRVEGKHQQRYVIIYS